MANSSTNIVSVILFLGVISFILAAAAQSNAGNVSGMVLDPQRHTVTTSNRACPPQLSGTVVDTSGAVIAGASVQVRGVNGTVQRTAQSDRNGSFMISGLPAGNY